jgi:ABC-type phosphate/phosphonate transport system substrate-binding protein
MRQIEKQGIKTISRRLISITAAILIALVATLDLAGVQSKSKIQFGLAGSLLESLNASDALAATKIWAENLGMPEGLWDRVDTCVLYSHANLIDQVNHGLLDIIAIPTLEYIAIEHELAAKPAVTYVLGNQLETKYVLLVSRDAGIKTLDDLKDKRIGIFSKGGAHSLAKLWLDVYLMKNGFEPKEKFFKDVINVSMPSQAILPVFFNQLDAAVVSSLTFELGVELNPQLGQRLKIFSSSEPFVTTVVCLRNNLDENIKNRYVDCALNAHENLRTFQIFTLYRVTRIVRWESSYLDNVRKLIENFKQLSKGREFLAEQSKSINQRK